MNDNSVIKWSLGLWQITQHTNNYSSKFDIKSRMDELRIWVRGRARRSHSYQDSVQPFQGAVQLNLNPAGGSGNALSPIINTPSLYKTDTNLAHVWKLVHSLEVRIRRLTKLSSKLLEVEDWNIFPRKNLADGCRMPTITNVCNRTLNKDTCITQTLRVHDTTDLVKMDTFANTVPGFINFLLFLPFSVGKDPQTKSVQTVWTGETVDNKRFVRSLKHFTNTVLHLVVLYRAPESRLNIVDEVVVERRWGAFSCIE